MKSIKEMYFIGGRTKANKYASVCAFTTEDQAVSYFKQKYPRFVGMGRVYTQAVESFDDGSGLCVYSPNAAAETLIRNFSKASEL